MNELTIQERLGYDINSKLLIIHADDFGLCNSQNIATIKAIEEGSVNSLSIMVPCPWFLEAVNYLKYRPHIDVGIHLTLTCEWLFYKYRPVLLPKDVPSLVDNDGYFYNNIENAKIDELEAEIIAQIEKVQNHHGVKLSHIDCHMFVLLSNPECIQLYYKIGKQYNLPIVISKNLVELMSVKYIENYKTLIDNVIMGDLNLYHSIGLKNYYEYTLHNLNPGFNFLPVHTAYDNSEMQGITAYDSWEFGSRWRQLDFDFFTSNLCKNIIEQENIKLIQWRSIANLLSY